MVVAVLLLVPVVLHAHPDAGEATVGASGVGALLAASSAVAGVKRREKEGGRPLKQKGKAGSRHKGKQKGGAAAKPRRFSNFR